MVGVGWMGGRGEGDSFDELLCKVGNWDGGGGGGGKTYWNVLWMVRFLDSLL